VWGLVCVVIGGAWAGATGPRPAMKDFMGLCVHTVQFRPALYRPVCRLVRDYHGLNWDVGDETDFWPVFPHARNRVDWGQMYGDWVGAGFEINASIQLNATKPDSWVDMVRDAETYGFALARFFGPGGRGLLTSAEIGNEPGAYDDAAYRRVFEAMARGMRLGDPELKVVTCALTAGPSGKYAKSVECVRGLEALYDVLNVHSYAQVEGWPTWRRSYPEDGSIRYLKDIQAIIDWRDRNAAGKEVWLTEFGWDACTKPAPKEGTFKDWVGSTELEQARYLVRSFLVFSGMALDRAYIFWFNDNDEPHVHGSSGLTRNYEPKPAYHAVAYLYAALGDYRFEAAPVRAAGDLYVYRYRHVEDSRRTVVVAWSPTGSDRRAVRTIEVGAVEKAERMPTAAGATPAVRYEVAGPGRVRLEIDESPVFLFCREQ